MLTDCEIDSLLASSDEGPSPAKNQKDNRDAIQQKPPSPVKSSDDVVSASMESVSLESLETVRKRPATTPKANEGKKLRKVYTSRVAISANQKIDESCASYILRGLSLLQDNVPLTDPQPKFLGYGLQHDVLWIEPADSCSLEWLKSAMDELNKKSDQLRVEVQEYTPPPPLHRVAGLLPVCGQTRWLYSEVMKNITRLNPNLNTKFWRILAISGNRFSERKHLIIGVDENSLRDLENCNFKLYYRFSQLKLRRLVNKKIE